KSIQESGVCPYVAWGSARGLSLTADLRDAFVKVEAMLRAEPLRSTPPPLALRGWAPLSPSGVTLTNTGGAALTARGRGAKDKTVQEALQTLDYGGLNTSLLPMLSDGMALLTGVEERDGRSYSTFVLLLPSRDAAGAVDAMDGMVKKIAGSYGDTKYHVTIP